MVDVLVLDRDLLQAEILRVQDIVNAMDPNALVHGEVDRQLQQLSTMDADMKTLRSATFRAVKGMKVYVDDGHKTVFETLSKALDVLLAKTTDFKRKITAGNNPTSADSFKLKRIELPKFNGSFCDWQSFHDLFQTSVHSNNKMSGAEKMVHLKACLVGEAANIISSYPVSDANYAEAWKLVQARYSNKREIIFSHIKKFDDFKPLQEESSSGLRSLSDNINECTRSLQVLGAPVQHWDLIIIYFALKKLDKETKKEWLLEQGDALPTLQDFIKYIEKRAQALAQNSSSKRGSSTSSSDQRKNSSTSHHSSTSYSSSSRKPCLHCDQQHFLYQCKSFIDLPLEGRREFVSSNRLCFNCLMKGHSSYECKSSSSCKKCGKRHHTLLHSGHSRQPSTSSVEEVSVSAKEAVQSSHSAQHVLTNHVMLLGTCKKCGKRHHTLLHSGHSRQPSTSSVEEVSVSAKEAVQSSHSAQHVLTNHVMLLGTVVATAEDSSGDRRSCRVFLDSGSEAHFISEACVKRLGLKPTKTNISIKGIGGSSSQTATSIVNLTLYSKPPDQNSLHQRTRDQFSLPISALVLPQITEDMPRAQVKSEWTYITNKGIQPSDKAFYRPGSVDILLGAKATSRILEPENVVLGPKGTPSAMNTKFGWMLTGEVKQEASHTSYVTSHHAIIYRTLDSSANTFLPTSSNMEEEKNILPKAQQHSTFAHRAQHLLCATDNSRFPNTYPRWKNDSFLPRLLWKKSSSSAPRRGVKLLDFGVLESSSDSKAGSMFASVRKRSRSSTAAHEAPS